MQASAVNDFAPHPALARKLGGSFEAAYGWGETDILQFLENVSNNPGHYGAPDDHMAVFRDLHAKIKSLVNDGDKFKEVPPHQQLLRAKIINKTNPWMIPQYGVAPQKVSWRGKEEEFFIIFDFLGAFLSLMGAPTPATTEAALTAKNYSLPLVVLYGRWCWKLTAPKPEGSSPEFIFGPTVVQITWGTIASKQVGSQIQWFSFLGASCAGFSHAEGWQSKAQNKRWQCISKLLDGDYEKNYLRSPDIDANKDEKKGQLFGNCAETYPFLYILTDKDLAPRSYGIALYVSKLGLKTYDGSEYWKSEYHKEPCINCKYLLKQKASIKGDGDMKKRFQVYLT